VFAATWPERCRSLVTFGTPVQAYGWPQQILFRVLLAGYRIVGMVDYLSSAICGSLLSAATRSKDPEAVALVLDGLRTMERRCLANAMRSISLARRDLTPRLATIRCPTMFVTGTDHPEWTGVQAGAASRLLAEGSARVVPDTAYLIPLEAPEATIGHLRDFWSAHSVAASSDAARKQKESSHSSGVM
jgi:pimeloyl-ACP methyl ester carboxylesterase